MSSRIADEVELIQRKIPGTEYVPEGHWIRLCDWEMPGGWEPQFCEIVFQFPEGGYPGAPFYGFYTPVGVRYNGGKPNNYSEPHNKQPPFDGTQWAFFSVNPEAWNPGVSVNDGDNVMTWVRIIDGRLREGL